MYHFCLKNYKKIIIFHNYGHPNNLFFIEICNQILGILNYDKLIGDYNNTFHLSVYLTLKNYHFNNDELFIELMDDEEIFDLWKLIKKI